jgi:methyltransferase family protein
LILVSHTLEHLHSPRRALTSFRTVLRPSSGRIVIEVPNLDSLFTRLFQGLGTAFDTPRHLYLFGPATLERLLVETGFEVLRVRHRSDPRQIAKSLALVYKLFETRATAGSLVQDGEFLATLQPLVDFASARRMGGAIRITARRAE